MEKAKAVERENKDEISMLVADAEAYLKAHFEKEYYGPVKESCEQEKEAAKEKYRRNVAKLGREHRDMVSKLSDRQEIKDENYVYKNRLLMRRWNWKRPAAD